MELIFTAGKKLGEFVRKHWNGLLHPEETRAGLEIKNISELVKTADDHQKAQMEIIEKKIALYVSMGRSKEDIQETLMGDIEACQDPLSQLKSLIDKGVVTKIALAKPGDGVSSAKKVTGSQANKPKLPGGELPSP